jgi:hypothetical protein
MRKEEAAKLLAFIGYFGWCGMLLDVNQADSLSAIRLSVSQGFSYFPDRTG